MFDWVKLAALVLGFVACGESECLHTTDAGPCFEFSPSSGALTRCCVLSVGPPERTACHTRRVD